MDAKTLREKFLAEQPKELIDNLTPPLYALIDETIESVIDGTTSLDGTKANTEKDAITLISYGVLARIKVFRETILLTKANLNNVTINYRGTILNIK